MLKKKKKKKKLKKKNPNSLWTEGQQSKPSLEAYHYCQLNMMSFVEYYRYMYKCIWYFNDNDKSQ